MSKINDLIENLCPDGVEYKPITDVFDMRGGYTPSKNNPEYWTNGTVPWFRMEDIRENGHVLSDALQYVSQTAVKKNGLFPAYSIALATSATIGEHALITVECLGNQRFTFFSCNEKYIQNVNMDFMNYYFYVIDDWCKDHLNQGSFASVDMTALKNLEIPVPPRPVQEEIVRILDEYTDLEAELEVKLSEEIELKQKQYMFLTSELIDKLESDSVVPLESVCGVYDGTHSTPQYTDSGVRFVSVENINDLYGSKKFISEEAYEKFKIKPQIGDVFMTRIGTMGKCAIVDRDEPLGYYVSLALLRPDSTVLSSEYLRWYLESGAGWKELEARTLWNATPIKINKGEIGKMLIKVPSLAVQDVVVKKIKAYYDAKTSLLTLLNTELESRKKQYVYYRDQLLTFKRKEV